MVKKNNKKCILCGKTYTYCSRCEEFDHLPRWMEIYCSDNCRTIFNTLTEYNAKNITAKEAAEKIKDCDMSNVDRFHEFNKNLVEEIQKENSKNVPFEKNEKVEIEMIESTSEDEETEIETRKPVRPRKRK